MPKLDEDGTVTWTDSERSLLIRAAGEAEALAADLGSLAVGTASPFTRDSVLDRFEQAMESLEMLVGFMEDFEKWEFEKWEFEEREPEKEPGEAPKKKRGNGAGGGSTINHPSLL